MKCKHCGKEIIKCMDRWYHKEKSTWFCFTTHAEPVSPDKRISGKSAGVER